MGQYYKIVNTTKKEFLNPHAFGDGLKLLEFGSSGSGTMTGLAILLANSNNRGGGDLRSEHPIIGSWANDKIIISGDYAEKKDKGEQMNKKENLYKRCKTDYKDISDEVIKALCEDSNMKEALIERGAVEEDKPEITVHNNKEYITLATFISKRSGEEYKVKRSYNLLEERLEISCNCKGWIYSKHYPKSCKHTKYYEEDLSGVTLKFNEAITL